MLSAEPVMKALMAGEGMNCGGNDAGQLRTPVARLSATYLDQPTDPQQPNTQHDQPAQERQRGGNFRRRVLRTAGRRVDVGDDARDLEGHDCDGTDRDVFRGGKEGVDHDSARRMKEGERETTGRKTRRDAPDKGRVEAVLERQCRDARVGLCARGESAQACTHTKQRQR